MSDRDYFTDTAAWSWVLSRHGNVLHSLQGVGEVSEGGTRAKGVTYCGRSGVWNLPGLPSRLSLPRCRQCSRALGWPDGTGSPKNDPNVRELVASAEHRTGET